MESKVEESVDKRMVRYKGKRIMRQHIKNKPINLWGFKVQYRYAPKTGYLYNFESRSAGKIQQNWA